MLKVIRYLALLLVIAAAFSGGVVWRTWAGMRKKEAHKPLYYVDPMHPWYKSDQPGFAPDCGMRLEPVFEGGPANQERKPLYYRDPKAPSYRANAPGINPETGNDLEPVYEEVPANAVNVPAEKLDLMGLTFGTAEWTVNHQAVETTGRIVIDETRVVRVHVKTEGWIEKTFVDYTGELVRKGQPLLTMYSPEMLASEQELLLALKARVSMQHSSMAALQVSGDSLVEAARRRLELWDLSPAQIAEVENTGKPIRAITVYSPADGYVTEREAFPNQKIGPETKLYTLADLSRVWVMADVFEADAPSIHEGMRARVTVAATGRTYSGTLANIQPVEEASTRTLNARLELPNAGYQLRPDMWVNVTFQVGGGRQITVPAEALIDSGTVQIVYVDRGHGKLEPRRVEAGERFDNRVAITHGLAAGERIVTSGAFLLNSESQMRSATAAPPDAGTHPGGHSRD